MMLMIASSRILHASRSRMPVYRCHIVTGFPSCYSKNGALHNTTSRQFTDGLKGRVTDLFTNATKKVAETVKKTTDASLDVLEAQAKKASEQLSKEAQKVYEKGSSRASEALAKSKSSTEDALRSATQAALQTSKQAASQAGQAVSSKSTQVANATSERIRTSSIGMLSNAQEFGKKAVKWFFLWSLAAIGVYGLATSIPTALVRYAFTGGSKEEKVQKRRDSADDVADLSSQDKGWMRWALSGVRPDDKTIESQNASTSSKDYWFLPWGSSSSSGKD